MLGGSRDLRAKTLVPAVVGGRNLGFVTQRWWTDELSMNVWWNFGTWSKNVSRHLQHFCRSPEISANSITLCNLWITVQFREKSAKFWAHFEKCSNTLSFINAQWDEHLANFYITQIEHLANSYRTCIHTLSNILRTHIEHLANIYIVSIEHLVNVYRTYL